MRQTEVPVPLLLPIGVEGFTSQEDQELLSRIEKQLKRRFAIGSQVSEHSIIQDFTKQVGLPQGPVGGGRGALWAPRGLVPTYPAPDPVAQQLGWGRGSSSSPLDPMALGGGGRPLWGVERRRARG